MKVLNLNTVTRTANVLENATIELSEREMRFIVGANRKLASLNHKMYEAVHHGNITSDKALAIQGEISELSNRLAMIMAPKLEEALLVIDEQFINEFDVYQEDREEAKPINLKKKQRYDMDAEVSPVSNN